MTENQWTDVAAPAPIDPSGSPTPNERAGAAFAGRKDAAKDEATDVARTAADSAQNVAQTAKEEVAHVASEAKSSAMDLMNQAKSGLTSQAGTQQQKAAEGIRNISSQLHSMAEAPGEQGMATDLIREAAERTSSIAGWLENRDPGSLLSEVQTFARNKPGTFLLLAAGAGILAGRLTRGLTAGPTESHSATITPAQQVAGRTQQPALRHQETVVAAGSDADLHAEPVVGAGTPVSTASLPAGTSADTPLRFEDDPYDPGEGRQL
ncbi:hypothetical protein ACRB8A_08560 [Arthrobacter sp. G.S.26]|uniref:hypothetical protein n=1 Tax=Arthrobacter sp. G.S.26 TaxID=3433706 RepID=UPI003D7765AB